MKRNNILTVLALMTLVFISSCEKEFDAPEGHTLAVGSVITLDSLKNLYAAQGETFFTEDISIYGVVTADEENGNLYTEAYIQDENRDAMHLELTFPGGLYEGDELRINLKGTTLAESNGHLSLIDVDVDNNVVKQSTNNPIYADTIDLADLGEEHESKLVVLRNVQIVTSEMCEPFADGTTDPPTNFNRSIVDCEGNSVILRNSGYSSFANQLMPSGNGFLTCVVGQYNSDRQIYVRRPADMDGLTGERCGGEPMLDCESIYLTKDWNDGDLNSGGWTTQNVVGNTNWEASSFGDDEFARISNWNGSANSEADSWLISPAIDLSMAENPVVSFRTAFNYSGDPLEVYVSSDYSGVGDPNAATWTQLNPVLSPGSWVFTSSGNLDISGSISNSTYIAFRYLGSNSDGSTWEVDDVVVQEQ